MPILEFVCPRCGYPRTNEQGKELPREERDVFEELTLSFDDELHPPCPRCGATAERTIAVNARMRGNWGLWNDHNFQG